MADEGRQPWHQRYRASESTVPEPLTEKHCRSEPELGLVRMWRAFFRTSERSRPHGWTGKDHKYGEAIHESGSVIKSLDMGSRREAKGIYGRLPADRLKMSAMVSKARALASHDPT
jgi:hypothetical protein